MRHRLPGLPMSPSSSPHAAGLPRREFLAGAVAAGAVALTGKSKAAKAASTGLLGPILGHADESSAMVWMRAEAAGEFALEVTPEAGGKAQILKMTAAEKDDFCIHWRVTGLEPGSRYRYRILQGKNAIASDPSQVLVTAPKADAATKVRLAISSCAREDESSRAVWKRMAAEEVDGLVLIGDTPYIDSTELEKQT